MKALIVDDEQPARSTIRLLADWTLYDIDEVLEAETVEQAITCLRRSRPQIIITDIRMPQHDGLELMQWLHQNQPQAQVIVISAYNEFEYAISAMRLGALDYLLKPIQPAQLDAVLRRAAESCAFRLRRSRMTVRCRTRTSEFCLRCVPRGMPSSLQTVRPHSSCRVRRA